MKQLAVYSSLGEEYSVGWERDDLPMIHVFASVKPGTLFAPSDGRGGSHWPCKVCAAHGYTEQDYKQQIEAALQKGPL